ncbi:hypothetical protein, variant [Aphanomyces invadans]|uniref:EF-hand domain-containing protein n=1 Tax=Aphanomyces invadans TaxID=157072 RepID=A0A024URP2_9STRA|nr:hypothetical protein, variant [Aphanomyces invadans]ETW08298.1 hypothetical protein, variant [Aphanomyces invadans]|eukprot:XP_008862103.1 hypothetical protein, variant [Aphanomyces invadans]
MPGHPPSRRRRPPAADKMPWYRNTFDAEGVLIDEESGELSYKRPGRQSSFDETQEREEVERPNYQPAPRQYASTWTKRQDKRLDPLETKPPSSLSLPRPSSTPQLSSKLLGRMSWDPEVLEIGTLRSEMGDTVPPRDKLRLMSSLKLPFRDNDRHAVDISLSRLRTNTRIQAILKRDESKFHPPIARDVSFTPVVRARQTLLTKFSFHDSMSHLPTSMAEDDDDDDLHDKPDDRVEKAQSLSKHNQVKYFGESAKHAFYAHYHHVSSKQHLFRSSPHRAPPSEPSEDDEPTTDRSRGTDMVPQTPAAVAAPDITPRTRVVVGSLSDQRPAIPLIIRKHTTSVFDFSFQSLGDDYIRQFAACIHSLPFVEEINVRDNRLSDVGLDALLVAIHTNRLKLRKLDISENEIGSDAAKTLRVYIESNECTLRHLVMEKSDIDDFECAAFMTAFEKNTSVLELTMPRNRIGEAEQLNVVQPEITTGGEAIASMLYVNVTIAKLDLSWNLLRLESGVTLAKSLEFNKKLLELHVAYNACGDAGAMMFGHVLTINTTLRTLDLSYNNVGCRGALVLASAASKTKTLRHLLLNGNNIGKEGGRALMFAMCSTQTDQGCDIEITGCNLASTNQGKSGKGKIFDPTDPAGEYSLELTDPFDQMIATELLRLATNKKGCRFEKLKHHSRLERVKNKGTVIQLVHPTPSTVFNSPLDVFYTNSIAKHRGRIDNLQVDVFALAAVFRALHMAPSVEMLQEILTHMNAHWTADLDEQDFSCQFFHSLFEITDVDGSGGLDAVELKRIMDNLGSPMTDHDAALAIAQYDLDSSGTIEDFEFVELMNAHVRFQAFGSKHSLAGLDPNRFALRDAASNQIWHIPIEGRLEVSFVYEREAVLDVHDAKNRITDAGIAQLIRNIHLQAKSPQEKLEMLFFAINDSEILFSAAQAYELLERCGGLTQDVRVKAVSHALFQMITAKDAQRLVSTTLNLRERAKLKVDLGNAYAVIMGNPTAHFALDLVNKADRWVAQKLVETAQTEKKLSIASKRGDTSQHMNWENFRNETLEGEKFVLTTSFFNSLPQCGRLEFDYVSTSRPPKGSKALSNRRYEQLVKELAKDCVIIDIPEGGDQPHVPLDPVARAQQRWKKLRDYVRHNQFVNMINYARSHIFRIKNCRDEVRLKLVQIETAVSDRYLTAEQASRIVMSMPSGFHGRVEAARVLFARLVDVGNFCEIFDLLDRNDQAELIKSLGWLNVFNPEKPDRFYELDLSVLEDYNMAKILIRLAVIEEVRTRPVPRQTTPLMP